MKRPLLVLIAALFFLSASCAVPAQQAPVQPQPKAASPATSNEDFLRTADEVMAEVSALLSLPVKSPLKRSVRSREEVRQYLLRQLKEQKKPQQMEIDQKVLIKFGLLPQGFQLESFLVDLLTEQIAGLYDPKTQEFYISDTVSPAEVRVVMAHELVHALQDQHFKVDKWLEAAKPNDDAEFARNAVVEGSATAAMIDYLLRGQSKVSIATMPDLEPLIRAQMGAEAEKSDTMAKAPLFIRDSLLFPYMSGAAFTQRVLRSVSTWEEFHKLVFATPPVSTQQILHPDLYLAGVAPVPVTLPGLEKVFPARTWDKLDENLIGEFGLHGLLKQFLGEERALRRSPEWAGDRYAAFENKKTKELVILFRVRLEDEESAARFFGAYSEALELKHAEAKPADLFRRPNYFQFRTSEGNVFLRCHLDQCLTVEGVPRGVFDKIVAAFDWPASPAVPARPTKAPAKTALLPKKVIHHGGPGDAEVHRGKEMAGACF